MRLILDQWRSLGLSKVSKFPSDPLRFSFNIRLPVPGSVPVPALDVLRIRTAADVDMDVPTYTPVCLFY